MCVLCWRGRISCGMLAQSTPGELWITGCFWWPTDFLSLCFASPLSLTWVVWPFEATQTHSFCHELKKSLGRFYPPACPEDPFLKCPIRDPLRFKNSTFSSVCVCFMGCRARPLELHMNPGRAGLGRGAAAALRNPLRSGFGARREQRDLRRHWSQMCWVIPEPDVLDQP